VANCLIFYNIHAISEVLEQLNSALCLALSQSSLPGTQDRLGAVNDL